MQTVQDSALHVDLYDVNFPSGGTEVHVSNITQVSFVALLIGYFFFLSFPISYRLLVSCLNPDEFCHFFGRCLPDFPMAMVEGCRVLYRCPLLCALTIFAVKNVIAAPTKSNPGTANIDRITFGATKGGALSNGKDIDPSFPVNLGADIVCRGSDRIVSNSTVNSIRLRAAC